MRKSELGIFMVLFMLLACKTSDTRQHRPSPTASVSTGESLPPAGQTAAPDNPLTNPAQRLARAADVRHYLQDNEIPANVVAADRVLKVYYHRASADMDAIFETFCRQQNVDGLLLSGFETISINAEDSFGKGQTKSFPLTDCKKVKPIEWATPGKRIKSKSL